MNLKEGINSKSEATGKTIIMEKPEMSNDLLNKEAQELMEIFNIQLEELVSEGNNKVVAALITLGHLISKDVQILREENKILLKVCREDIPKDNACMRTEMRLFKDRVWKELHERVVNEDHIGKSGLWSSRDSEIFNSYPFKLLCEKVEELEDKLRGAIDFTIRDSVILSDMIINEIKKGVGTPEDASK